MPSFSSAGSLPLLRKARRLPARRHHNGARTANDESFPENVEVNPDFAPQIPCNREINREFCRIRPEEAIFAPAKAANSMLCREIPYATEQGIFGAITGNFFEEQGIFSSDQQRRKKPNQVSVRADGVFGSDNCRGGRGGCSCFGVCRLRHRLRIAGRLLKGAYRH